MNPFRSNRFLDRLHASLVPEERERVERVLAGARLFMAAASLSKWPRFLVSFRSWKLMFSIRFVV